MAHESRITTLCELAISALVCHAISLVYQRTLHSERNWGSRFIKRTIIFNRNGCTDVVKFQLFKIQEDEFAKLFLAV